MVCCLFFVDCCALSVGRVFAVFCLCFEFVKCVLQCVCCVVCVSCVVCVVCRVAIAVVRRLFPVL